MKSHANTPVDQAAIERAAKAIADRWIEEAAAMARERSPHAEPTDMLGILVAVLAKKVAILELLAAQEVK